MNVSPPRLWRAAAVALLLAWFFVQGLRDWIPLWLPFLGLAALELNFLLAGLRERGRRRRTPPASGRGPQPVDLRHLGGEEWLEPVVVDVDGEEVWLPAGNADGSDEADDTAAATAETPARRRRPVLARLAALIAFAAIAFALLVLVPEDGWDDLDRADRARTEALLSREAGRIAGHPARVRCDARGEAVGVVQHSEGVAEIGGARAYLTPSVCFRLQRLAFADDEGAFSQTARAIAVVAHEAWHLHGESDEGIVNCYAFQSGVELGRRLGLSERTAARMMRQQLADNATYARSAPRYLVPRECRDGGPLDLNPESSRFP